MFKNPLKLSNWPPTKHICYIYGVIFCIILSIPMYHGMESISPGDVKRPEELPLPDVEKMVSKVVIKFSNILGVNNPAT